MTKKCPNCDRKFSSERSWKIHNTKTHKESSERRWESKEKLYQLYHEEGLSQSEVADRLNTCPKTISNWMRKMDIPRDKRKNDRVPYIGMDSYGHIQWQIQIEASRYSVPVHRLLAVSEYGFDEVVKKDVHHINGIPWDNRDGNIIVLNPEEHQALHADKGKRDTEGNFA